MIPVDSPDTHLAHDHIAAVFPTATPPKLLSRHSVKKASEATTSASLSTTKPR